MILNQPIEIYYFDITLLNSIEWLENVESIIYNLYRNQLVLLPLNPIGLFYKRNQEGI